MVNPKKVYSIDTGLSKRISFEVGRKKGDLLENVIFLELKRRFEEIYYYKTKDNYEVDFLIKQNEKITHLIQISLTITDQKTLKREIRALKKAKEELNCDAKMILLTFDNTHIEEDNVEIHNAIKWLLF